MHNFSSETATSDRRGFLRGSALIAATLVGGVAQAGTRATPASARSSFGPVRLGWIGHIFGRVCAQSGIEDRLTKPYHPWTNGQAERMVRTIKEATVKSFHYTSINELRRHVRDWLVAYNFAKRLKVLRFKTPYEAIEELWNAQPDIFNMQPRHHMLGLNT